MFGKSQDLGKNSHIYYHTAESCTVWSGEFDFADKSSPVLWKTLVFGDQPMWKMMTRMNQARCSIPDIWRPTLSNKLHVESIFEIEKVPSPHPEKDDKETQANNKNLFKNTC